MKHKLLSFAVVSLLICSALLAARIQAAEENRIFNRLQLAVCSVSITADQIETFHDRITYSGNVKAIIGFASLRSNKLTVIKNNSGGCELISE